MGTTPDQWGEVPKLSYSLLGKASPVSLACSLYLTLISSFLSSQVVTTVFSLTQTMTDYPTENGKTCFTTPNKATLEVRIAKFSQFYLYDMTL